MTARSCGHHHDKRRRLCRLILILAASTVVLVSLVVLIVFLVLQPKKPRFALQDVTVFDFNVSSTNSVTSKFQVTVSSRNPNDRIGIFYDKLDIYATYRNQPFTDFKVIPTTYQGHNDAAVWSPFLGGNDEPVWPYLAASLEEDKTAGLVPVDVRIKGVLKWKVGTWISGRYRINVSCPASVSIGNQIGGMVFGPATKLDHSCYVEVSSGGG